MNLAMVLRRRRSEKLKLQRRRNWITLAASLLIHIVIFLLFPGLVVQSEPTVELLVEIVKPASAAAEKPATAPRTAPDTVPEATPAPAEPDPVVNETEPAAAPPVEDAAPQPAADVQEATNPPVEQPVTQPPRQDASDIATVQPLKPIVVEESPHQVPQQVEDVPVVAEAKPAEEKPADKPVEQPKPEPEVQPEPAPVPVEEVKPQAKPQPKPVEETSPAADPQPRPVDTPSAKPDPAPPAVPEETGSGTDTTEVTGEDDTAPEEGPPAPPPGPSEHELNLLGDYGDGARLRIRAQARNTEDNAEGTVTFEFEVARDGHLVEVKVLRTSGYSSIDNDAIEATRAAFNERAEKIPFPRDLTVASWKFVMSLKYPLW